MIAKAKHVNRIKPLGRTITHRVNGNGNGHANGNGRAKPAEVLSAELRKAAPAASPETARDPHKVELEVHPYCELLPPLSPGDYDALRNDIIRTWRVRDAIVLLDGKILDGRHKYRIAKIHGVEFRTRDFDPKSEGDPIDWVYSNSLGRNMDQSQKAAAAVQLEESLEAQAKERLSRRAQMKAKIDALSLKQLEAQYPKSYGLLLSKEEIINDILDKALGKEPSGSSRDRAGLRYGVSGRYIQDAKLLKEKAPELFQSVFNGELPVKRALAEHQRRQRAGQMVVKAAAAKIELKGKARLYELFAGDALKILPTLDVRPRLIFTDPRYNLGFDYGMGKDADSSPEPAYLDWCKAWICQLAEMLTDDGSMFVMIDARHQAHLFVFMSQVAGLQWRNTIIMDEGFGNYTADNFTPCARFIHYFGKHRSRRVWNGGAILIPSDRQLIYNDSRAVESGKVPGNVWRDFPRLVGNAKERMAMPGFPTQLPVALVERIVKVASDPGDLVLDPFNGTGTTGEAAIVNGRRYLGIDIVPRNVEWSEKRLAAVAGEMAKRSGK
jgi:site-specific DNA-methyltransferase (adenine-specific)